MPPLVLDPSQYYNYTQPQGNHMPVTNVQQETHDNRTSFARAEELQNTFKMPSGEDQCYVPFLMLIF